MNRLGPLRPMFRATFNKPLPTPTGSVSSRVMAAGFHHQSSLRTGDEFGKEPTAEGDKATTGGAPSAVDDRLGSTDARGRTGGGKKLEKGSHPPPQPKISNLSVPGTDGRASLTPEQREEVERHNREFDEKHDRASEAADDKVDKKFWSGGGGGV